MTINIRETTRSNRRAARPRVESLERREILAAGVASPLPAAMSRGVVHAQVASKALPPAGDDAAVSFSARTSARRLLGGSSHAVRPLATLAKPGVAGVIVSAADLRRPGVGAALRRAYATGRTVALADATPKAAERLRTLLGQPSSVTFPDGMTRAALIAFRRVQVDGRTQFNTDLLGPRPAAARVKALGTGPTLAATMLDRVLDPSPAVAKFPASGAVDNNLLNATTSYESSALVTNNIGDETQVIDMVWNARAFDLQQDFYYVLQETDHKFGPDAPFFNHNANSTNSLFYNQALPPGVAITLIQPSPQTTQVTQTITSGTSYTIGASVGFNQAQGFNVSISASETVSNSTTVAVPPVSIINQSDLVAATPAWEYDLANAQSPGATVSFFNQWIWAVPFAAYQPGQTQVGLSATAYTAEAPPYTVDRPNVPLPFGTVFQIQPPVVTGVGSARVNPGDTFTISGTGLYPSLVTSVLVGGVPLSPEQYSTVSDTKITAVAPNVNGRNLPVVVQTTKGVSNDTVAITIL